MDSKDSSSDSPWVCVMVDTQKKGIVRSTGVLIQSVKTRLREILKVQGRLTYKLLNGGGIGAMKGDISLNVAQTASFLLGGVGAVMTSHKPARGIRPWLLSQILEKNLCPAVSTGSGDTPDTGASHGGSGDGADHGGGGDNDNGANSKISDCSGRESGGSGPSGYSGNSASTSHGHGGHQDCGGVGDAVNQDDIDTDITEDERHEPTEKVPSGQGTTLDHSRDETESDSDVEIEPGQHSTLQAGEEVQERKLGEVRARVIAEIRDGFATCSHHFGESTERGMDKILSVYQAHDCTPQRLFSMDGEKVLVLTEYNGDDPLVLLPRGPLLPGGQFMIMISARWRKKERTKNDPAFRHSSNALQMSLRTKHLTAVGVCKIQPIRLFKHGASMALISQDKFLKKNSMVLGFTSIPHTDKCVWNEVRKQVASFHDQEKLSDGLRMRVRQFEFAIKIFNQKGMALGAGAIGSAQIAEDGAIRFHDLSQSALFPETPDSHSRQAQQAVPLLNRQNTSCSWPQHEPGQSTVEFFGTFLSDEAVLQVLQKERQSGNGLALPNSVSEHVPRNQAFKNEAAFQKDRECVAQNLACVLRFSTSQCSEASADQRASLAKEISVMANSKRKFKATFDKNDQMIRLLAGQGSDPSGSSGPSQRRIQDRAWKRCADWVLQSLARTKADCVEDHLFLTAYIPQLSLTSLISEGGLRVEETAFRLPETWKLKGTCPFLNQQLPAVVVKLESNLKGLGLFVGRAVRAKDLLAVYIGELETDPDIRPTSRMVVKQTRASGYSWGYCYGIEDLDMCVKIGPALGPYANAPSHGEHSNCNLDRNQSFLCTNESGKVMIGFPMFATRDIVEDEPVLWTYVPTAGRGRNLVTLA